MLPEEHLTPVTAELRLDDRLLDRLAHLVAKRLASAERPRAEDGWLDAGAAATYLGLPNRNAMHKLTAARVLPFSQEAPGAKMYFRRRDLEAHREAHVVD